MRSTLPLYVDQSAFVTSPFEPHRMRHCGRFLCSVVPQISRISKLATCSKPAYSKLRSKPPPPEKEREGSQAVLSLFWHQLLWFQNRLIDFAQFTLQLTIDCGLFPESGSSRNLSIPLPFGFRYIVWHCILSNLCNKRQLCTKYSDAYPFCPL